MTKMDRRRMVDEQCFRMEEADITFAVCRKAIKHCYIRVDRSDGQVRVSAPMHMSDAAIRTAVVSRHAWIVKRQRSAQRRVDHRALEFVAGEPVLVFGVAHRLNIVESTRTPRIEVADGQLLSMCVRPGTSREQSAELLEQWYRSQLRLTIPELIRQWEPMMGVQVHAWGIRRMRTRWGSCNTRAQRIWLNLELARRPLRCLEYVLVHEMAHLHERGHNARFYGLMDRYLPDWRDVRALLNEGSAP
jgi:predicted metal-dependent hydrolase